ncbi:MOSC domain-containing protein [uncultured Alsobacter sp.]|uniref:MOSC domain-containing protein n=1 Tax=uncultured Alsobacter sp. TaxID=1748258 RepID=UPI0025E7B2A9|nr:MOSC domain-containing protein [uncultured Alsobacter sp.]
MTRPIVPARKLPGRIASVLFAGGPGFETAPVDAVTLDFDGLSLPDGTPDRHHGPTRGADARVPWYGRGTTIRNTRQVSIVASAELAAIAEGLGVPEVRPEWLGANIVIDGVPDLSMLPRGTRILVKGGAALAVDDQNAPCRQPGRVLASRYPDHPRIEFRFVEVAKRLRGLTAFVERAGPLRVGDVAELRLPEQWLY